VAYYLNLWLPTYLVRQQKFTVVNAGISAALPLVAAVFTVLFIGGSASNYLVKKGASPLGLWRNLFAIGMFATVLMLFATAYAPDPYTALAFLSLAWTTLGFSTSSLWVALVEATLKPVAGTMGGVQNFGGNIAGIVVSVLTGYILQVTQSFFLALLAGSVAALGAFSALLLISSRRV
jgi:sugar phosphate permease